MIAFLAAGVLLAAAPSPADDTATLASREASLPIVDVEPGGGLMRNGRYQDDLELKSIAKGGTIYIRADKYVRYSDFMTALNRLQRIPNVHVSLIAEEAKAPQ